ncbi:MAG TPA: hypothetical protein PK710_15415, partial [Polyangiaceae bacterium]|nr:hypothetical protein [Polyangiaceae bacterium]
VRFAKTLLAKVSAMLPDPRTSPAHDALAGAIITSGSIEAPVRERLAWLLDLTSKSSVDPGHQE